MANAIFPKYKQSAISGDASTDLIQSSATTAPFVSLVDTGTYTYSSAHQFFSSLSGIQGTDQQLTTPTATNGTFDADDATFTAVTGVSIEALVIYRKNAGANTTWRLVLYEDTGVTGLPVTPNGGNIVVTWNASGIFTICDCRLKKDIVQVAKIGRADIYEFSYIWEQNQRHIGPMAQEVERYAPEAVHTFADGWKAVDQSALAAALA